jgi:hypothetical protein
MKGRNAPKKTFHSPASQENKNRRLLADTGTPKMTRIPLRRIQFARAFPSRIMYLQKTRHKIVLEALLKTRII